MPAILEQPKKISVGVKSFKDTMIFECTGFTEATADRPFMVKGRFQKAEARNGNGRIYPRTLWEKILQDAKIMERVKGRMMMGEVEHPADGQTDLKRVSHVITHLEMTPDGDVIGEAEIFDTKPQGENLKELFRKKVKVGISSRGKGTSFMKGNTEVVNDDYMLETFDFVYNPSTEGAYPEKMESVRNEPISEERLMADLKDLRAIATRTKEISKLVETASIVDVSKFDDELVENLVKCGKLVSDDPSLQTYGSEVLESIKAIRKVVGTKLGTITESGDELQKARAEAERWKREATSLAEHKITGKRPKKEAEEPLRTDPDTSPEIIGKETSPTAGKAEEENPNAAVYEAEYSCGKCQHREAREESGMTTEEEVPTCPKDGSRMVLDAKFRRTQEDDTKKCPNHPDSNMVLDPGTGDHTCQACGYRERKLERMSKGEIIKRYVAAVRVVEALNTKCKHMHRSNKTLRNRFEAAIKLIGETSQQHERIALRSKVNEYLRRNPELKKIESRLLAARNIKEMESTVRDMLPILKSVPAPKPAPKKESKDPLPPKGADNRDPKKVINERRDLDRMPADESDRQVLLSEKVLARLNLG